MLQVTLYQLGCILLPVKCFCCWHTTTNPSTTHPHVPWIGQEGCYVTLWSVLLALSIFILNGRAENRPPSLLPYSWLSHKQHSPRGSITVLLTSCLFCLGSLLCLCWISITFTCLVQSTPVKQEVNRTVILPPIVSVLWFINGLRGSSANQIECL